LRIEPLEPLATASTAPTDTAAPVPDDPDDGAIDLAALPGESGDAIALTETAVAAVIAPRIRLTPAPAKGFVEAAPAGPLPKRAGDGRRPFDVYARPVHRNVLNAAQPKIAILLGGLGINPELTKRAIRVLPEEVTFAFAPYGKGLQSSIDEARARGHEVMLQLPMEPFDYPARNPGQNTLLVAMQPAETSASLSWLLSRFTGYTGVVNYLGARLTSEPAALTPIMRTLQERGLVYVDDGSSPRSAADEVASSVGLPIRHVEIVIDGDADFDSISAKLRKLEEMGSGGRIVIGIGTGLPATIDAVENWAKKLPSRGILLVPVSAGFSNRAG
ncbi:MAG: divergent polysaccharide deacetylase family protein, partial [Aestuariivirgaceae bacterium]